MSRTSLVAMIVAITLASCKNGDDASGKNSGAAEPSKDDATTPLDAAIDTAAHDSDTADTSRGDVVDGGEHCPSALYPPRTDGCPCFPPTGNCTEAELGKTCDYTPGCPGSGSGTRVRCERVYPKEGPMEIKWIYSSFGCPKDAGSD